MPGDKGNLVGDGGSIGTGLSLSFANLTMLMGTRRLVVVGVILAYAWWDGLCEEAARGTSVQSNNTTHPCP